MAKYDVKYLGKTYKVDKDDYILDVLEKQGVVIPYSCRAGSCTVCLCFVSSGSVDDDSNITTDNMKRTGLCSPCVASPRSDVTLDFIGEKAMELFGIEEPMELNSNLEAVYHYFFGGGAPIGLGQTIIDALMSSPEHQSVLSDLMNGNRAKNGYYEVNLTGEMFHVGGTGVTYTTACAGGVCTTTFTGFNRPSRPDGFRDPADIWDIMNGEIELPFGTPYNYLPYIWPESYPDPGNWSK